MIFLWYAPVIKQVHFIFPFNNYNIFSCLGRDLSLSLYTQAEMIAHLGLLEFEGVLCNSKHITAAEKDYFSSISISIV